jgi:GT2 family glycosyltransferase
MRIDIIIVNWNSGHQLFECLDSIRKNHNGVVCSVVIVDNASTDDSIKSVPKISTLPVHIIHNDENLGFARACNQGGKLGNAPYLLFLNPDTMLFANSLSTPCAFMEQKNNNKTGICGIQLLNEQNERVRTCSRFPTLSRLAAESFGLVKVPGFKKFGTHMNEWDHSSTQPVDQIMGAFFLVRRDLFENLRGFDERFFVYFEEVDFSRRARQTGYKSIYLADAQAFHAGGGTSRQVKAMRLFYFLRSKMQYGFKHFSSVQAWILVGITMLIEPFTRIFFCAVKGDWQGIKNTIHGYHLLWKAFPAITSYHRPKQP